MVESPAEWMAMRKASCKMWTLLEYFKTEKMRIKGMKHEQEENRRESADLLKKDTICQGRNRHIGDKHIHIHLQ